MRKFVLTVFISIALPACLYAQYQTADDGGYVESNYIKKIDKEADYGAYHIEKEYGFGVGKGIDKMPVAAAYEKGDVQMVSAEDDVDIAYLLPSNSFMVVADYDFGVYYKNNFKSQKYPPYKFALSNDDIFLDDNYAYAYAMHAKERGQRCRFTYDYRYTDAKYLTRVFFHQNIPVKEITVSFKVPPDFTVDIKEENFAGYKVVKNKDEDKKGNTIYSYSMYDLPAVKQEGSSLARPFYLPHLVITVKKFTADKKEYNGFNTLDDLYAWYNYLYKSAKNDPSALKTQVTKLTQSAAGDEEKIKSIYYWVQDNIRYIAYEEGYAGFIPQTVQDVYKNKYGDCKGMANLLTEMLKLAGYDAHFAWIGTRDIPYDIKDVKSLCTTNHAICVLYWQGKTYFLDGTEKYAPFGVDAYRIQGKTVLVQNGDSYKTEQVPAAKISDNTIFTKANLSLKDAKITGHIILTFDGAAKNFFHNVYNNIPAARRKDFINSLLEIKTNNTDVSNVVTSDFKNRDIPLTIEGDVEVMNEVTKAENLDYFGIDFFPATITGFYPDKDRQTPLDLNELILTKDEVTLTLPAQASVKYLPKPLDAKYNDDIVKASYANNGNTITLSKELQIASPVIFPKDFQTWKDFLNQIKEYNRNSISIKTN